VQIEIEIYTFKLIDKTGYILPEVRKNDKITNKLAIEKHL